MTTTRRTRATRATDAPGAEDATAKLLRLAAERGAPVLGVALPTPAKGKAGVPPLPGVYRMEIPGWAPTLLNQLMGNPMKAAGLKKRDLKQILAAKLVYGVPDAAGRRRVNITISRDKGRIPDPDSPLKSTLDALKMAGLIVDDSARWCLWSCPRFVKGPKGTVIELEDIDAEGEGDAN